MRPQDVMSVSALSDIFDFDPDTGLLTWKVILSAYTKIGQQAGYVCDKGYRRVQFKGMKCRTHVLGWAMHFGSWPYGMIDHVNGDRKDNRIANLRIASYALNARNRRNAHSQNSTQMLGAHKRGKRFTAAICVDGRQYHLGFFDTALSAHHAYIEAKRKLHAEAFNDPPFFPHVARFVGPCRAHRPDARRLRLRNRAHRTPRANRPLRLAAGVPAGRNRNRRHDRAGSLAVRISDILEAAIGHLHSDSNPDGCYYSCFAIDDAIYANDHGFTQASINEGLRNMGLNPGSSLQFSNVPQGHRRQYARALWLTWAAMMAREQGV